MPDLRTLPPLEGHCWLDKHIAEQAKFYGMTVEKHRMFQRDVSTEQERRERERDDNEH